MKKEKLLMIAAVAGLVSGAPVSTTQAARDGYQACKGVSPSGSNSCGAYDHACGGYARRDWDSKEWVYVKEGGCKMVQDAMKNPVIKAYVKEVAKNAFKYWRRAPITKKKQ